jgi:hypothetical protein
MPSKRREQGLLDRMWELCPLRNSGGLSCRNRFSNSGAGTADRGRPPARPGDSTARARPDHHSGLPRACTVVTFDP